MTTTPIPRRVTDRPTFRQLSPAENDEFLRTQAGLEAAYRTSGDPQALCHALVHVYGSRQTIPKWLEWALLNFVVEHRTDEAAKRDRDRMRHARRFAVVRDLRNAVNEHTGKKYTKDEALDLAVESLAKQRAAAARETIEDSYDKVRKDLDRQGSESEFFYLVELAPEAPALAPRADSTLWTADSTIPTADTAGGTAAPGTAPWFMRIAKR
jgi:hypothetical protein